MNLPVYIEKFVSVSEFVAFWSRQYTYDNEHLYDENIGKELTEDRIWKLFLWKNGKPLSEKKRISVKQNFIDEKIVFPPDLDNIFLEIYLNRPGGAIWRIFWLHCNYPKKYPIYDQHVHRTMASMKKWKELEIPYYNKSKVDCYISYYLPFWREFSDLPPKKVDEALWIYGKFLKSGYDFR